MRKNEDINLPTRKASASKSKKKLIKVSSSDFVISQITIVSSCSMPDGHQIDPQTVEFINANGNSWKNEDMEKYYSSFIAGHNFLEHDQVEKRSYGFIADAVLRKREVGSTFIYDVDLLIATAKRNTPNDAIVNKIAKDKSAKFSMGCLSSAIQCSYCGKVSASEADDCTHLKSKMGSTFITASGGVSEISAIVVPMNPEDSPENPTGYINFIEASIVNNPAYGGAVLGYVLDIPDNQDVYFEIPTDQYNRKTFNGIAHWAKKGMVVTIK